MEVGLFEAKAGVVRPEATVRAVSESVMREIIAASNLAEVIITDTVPLQPEKRIPRIKVLSVAPLA